MGLAGERMVELASGVDALYLSGRAALPVSFLETLEVCRGRAVSTGVPVEVAIGEESFEVAGHSFGKYRFCLRHRHGQIGVTPSRHLPPLRVQPRAEFLHGVGPLPAVTWFEEALWSVVGAVRFSVSRLDLHSDWQGWELGGDDRRRFVCRADQRDLHEVGEELTGFEFGRRTSGTICARIYDKSREREHKGTDFWLDIWGDAYDESRPVLRVEFELGRQVLKEFGVDTPDEAINASGALWAAVTEDWLTYRSPTADETKSRWPMSPEWLAVQHAQVRSGAFGLDRMYEGRRKGSLRTIMRSLNGYMASFAALASVDSIEEACRVLPPFLRDYEIVTGRAFTDRVAEKTRLGV